MQQVTLPSYEEALRDGVNINHCQAASGSGSVNNNNHVFPVDSSGSSIVAANQQQISALPVNAETVLGGNASTDFDEHNALNIATSQTTTSSLGSQMFYACANNNTVAIPTR